MMGNFEPSSHFLDRLRAPDVSPPQPIIDFTQRAALDSLNFRQTIQLKCGNDLNSIVMYRCANGSYGSLAAFRSGRRIDRVRSLSIADWIRLQLRADLGPSKVGDSALRDRFWAD